MVQMVIAARVRAPPTLGTVLATKRRPRGSRLNGLFEAGDLRSYRAGPADQEAGVSVGGFTPIAPGLDRDGAVRLRYGWPL